MRHSGALHSNQLKNKLNSDFSFTYYVIVNLSLLPSQSQQSLLHCGMPVGGGAKWRET